MTIDVSGIVADGRAMVAGLMRDACAVARGGVPTYDEASGAYTTSPGATVYAGPCRVKAPTTAARQVDAGQAAVSLRMLDVALPFEASGPVRIGDLLTVTSSDDPWLTGKTFSVAGVSYSATATARHLTVEDSS